MFLMPRAQVESLAFLIAGTWTARDTMIGDLCNSQLGGFNEPPVFPDKPSGGGPDRDFAEEHKTHDGLVLHANVAPKKWDAAGLDPVQLEDRVAVLYSKQKEGIANVG